MNHSSPARTARHTLLTVLAALLVAACGTTRLAADTASHFVERLRQEGHADLVLDYLDRAADSPLVSEEFKSSIPVQRLTALYAQANAVRNPAARAEALGALLPELRDLAKSNDGAARLLTDLVDRFATASADAGRRSAIEATRRPDGTQRERALEGARRQLEAAREKLADAEARIRKEYQGLKGVQSETDEWGRRSDLGARLGLVRLLGARLLHEQAETHAPGSKEWKQLNKDAAKQLGELYNKYSKWGVGLYAHLYEGRCYRLLGENQLALAALEDLTSQPAPTPELRRIVSLAHAERAALLVGTDRADQALEKPVDWLEKLDPDEKKGAEAATLRYQVAQAALKLAEKESGAKQRKLRRDARDWLGDSARVPSDVQAAAREQWAAVTASMGIVAEPPKTFDEAFQAGGEAIQAMLAVDVAIEMVTAAEAEQLTAQRAETRVAAYAALTAAVKLVDKKTDPDQAAQARYQLAWLDWEAGNVKQAAERAEYVARRDATTPSGKEAARLTLAAIERLQSDGASDASGRLRDFVAFVLEQWPNTEVAASASAVLVSNALRSGDLAAAERVLETVPKDQRPALALRLAVARWEKDKSDPASRDAAHKQLETAFKAASETGRSGGIGVTAALYLTEVAIDRGDAQRARELLNNADHGPMTRVMENRPPADNPAFALAALRAQARTQAITGKDIRPTLDQVADLLAASPAERTGGERAWLGLAVILLADVERTPAVAPALAATLGRLGKVEASGDWNTRLWIAQSRLRCGELLKDTDAARESLTAGREAFAGLIEQAERQPDFAPTKTATLAARLRLAQCERELGDYAAAVETLTQMLAGRGALLEVQETAAETLQTWGTEAKSVERLEEAIAGAKPGPDGKNQVWGWSKLAAVTGRFAGSDPKRRGQFFNAWRNVAASRYQAALLASGSTRSEQLRKAASTIRALQRQNPDLGGDQSKRSFDQLLRQIQAASGENATGLTGVGR